MAGTRHIGHVAYTEQLRAGDESEEDRAVNVSYLISQAATAGDVETVRDLLQSDPALVHSHSSDGWTPLHAAARGGQTAVAETLLACDVDVDARARNSLANTPLLCAVIGEHIEAVRLLLAHGANVNGANEAGATPLHKAAVLGNSEIVRLLLAHGANVNARNSGGQTALTHALYKRHEDVATLLRQHGASE